MSYDRDEYAPEETIGCLRGIGALIRLLAMIYIILNGIRYAAPSKFSEVIGAETHTNEPNEIAWYSQDPNGRFFESTSDKNLTVVEELPYPVSGVASKQDGALILLFKLETGYWLGDIHGPQTRLDINKNLRIDDIAVNGNGIIHGACEDDKEIFDCLGDPPLEFGDLPDDQKYLALTLDDTTRGHELWCAVIDAQSHQSKIDRCPNKK